MKAILLARVSTEEQKEAGNSLPAQVFKLKEYIEKDQNLELDKEFTFDESAYKAKRQKFDVVTDYIKSQKEKVALCCDKVDRLARDFMIGLPRVEQLRRDGKVELHFPGDNLILTKDSPATDLFHFNIAVSLAQYYSNAIGDNTRRVIQQMLRDGRWIGSQRIGYIKVTLEDGSSSHGIDPLKGPLILEMFKLFATGNYSVKTVREEIHKRGLLAKSGKKLAPSMVHKILTDKFYIGTMTSKGKEYSHIYPKIVSDDLFERVQKILVSRRNNPSKMYSKFFIFGGGFLTHEVCGGVVGGQIKKGKYIYYGCSGHKGCDIQLVKEEDLLKSVGRVFGQIKMTQKRADRIASDLKKMNESKSKYHRGKTTLLQDEYNTIQAKSDKLLDLYIDGGVPKDVYEKRISAYKKRQDQINIEMEEYTKADENFHVAAATVFALANKAGEIFESSEPTEKRQLLKYVFQNCRLSGKNLEFDLRSPFDTIVSTKGHPIGLRRQDSNL